MTLRLRDALADDLATVAGLNEEAGQAVAPLGAADLLWRYQRAPYFRIAEVDGVFAGFLIALDAGSGDGNPGYHWFRARHERFLYVDRIVVASGFRGLGLGRVLYADLISFAEVRVPVLGCQVALEPRDDAALLFHASLGFRETGQVALPGQGRACVMTRELCSYPWVRDTWLATGTGALPALPWLSDRDLPGSGPGRRLAAGG